MTDVLKIALDRRAELHEEVARIDDFIRMAESLMHRLRPTAEQGETPRDLHPARDAEPAFREQPAMPNREPAPGISAGVTRMNLMRRAGAAAG